MVAEQLLLQLPEELVRRFRRVVPSGKRSLFMQHLPKQALPDDRQDDDPLYRVGLAVEQDERLAAEVTEWETAMAGDGLTGLPPFRSRI